MLIDFHTHAFPEKIAPKAMEKLSFVSGGLVPYTNGTFEGLIESMNKNGVDKSVVLSIATSPKQQTNVNDFASLLNQKENLMAFGSVFPFAEDSLYELERIKSLGLKGVKLHPDYQGFSVDDERLKPLYKKISDLGLVTIFHAGFDYGFTPPYGATPEKLLKALSWFDSPIVAAHWGGLNCNQGVLDMLCGREIYFDTSFGYSQMPKYYALKIIEKHGTDKLLFGSDTPWHTPCMEKRLLDTLGLSDKEMEKINYLNATGLLGI